MLKTVSVTSLGSLGSMQSTVSVKNRPPEYRRNINGTAVFIQVILFGLCFLVLEAYWLVHGSYKGQSTVIKALMIGRMAATGLMLVNLVVALCIRGYGLEQPFIKYFTLPLAALSLLPLPFIESPIQPGRIVLTIGCFVEVVLIYMGLLTQSRKSGLGRNVQPWYERTPLLVTNVEIGRSVSMLRAASPSKR